MEAAKQQRGVEVNSFYDVNEEENNDIVNTFYGVHDDGRTEEEYMEYKRFLGIPLPEDYEEIIKCLK